MIGNKYPLNDPPPAYNKFGSDCKFPVMVIPILLTRQQTIPRIYE